MESQIPAGDVVKGLAWSYVVNYLDIAIFSQQSSLEGKRDKSGKLTSIALFN